MNRQAILRKAQIKIKEQDYINICIEGEVCPECGKDLFVELDPYLDYPVYIYKCVCCFRH